MSDYNIQVTWSGKDALADSDPDKVISGGDFSTEFTAVKTAVNSKANTNGDASKDFSSTTQAVGNDTTFVATTAYVQAEITAAKINALTYPIGSIYTAVVSTNPATLLGVGVWSAFGAGRVMVGLDSSDTDFDTIEEIGGSKTHTLTTSEMPAHNHDNGAYDKLLRVTGSNTTTGVDSSSGEPDIISTGTIASAGGGAAHNIVQPYITVYMWKRTS